MGMIREPEAPADLRALQADFGRSIRMPFGFSTGRFVCAHNAYSEAIAEAVSPRGSQSSRERLAVYNRQYWYRLLTAMQDDFPLLGATLGLWEFNRLASGYLHGQPSRSPLLDGIAAGFAAYLRGTGTLGDRDLGIAELEWSRLKAFHAAGRPALDPARLTPAQRASLEDSPLALQPWFSLHEEDWNLVECRRALDAGRTQKPEFKEGRALWAVFRNAGRVDAAELEPAAFQVLKALNEGMPLGEACQWAAERDPRGMAAIANALPGWFAAWTAAGWFAHPGAETGAGFPEG
jgi:hypothetical protein